MKNIESINEFDGKLTETEIELLRESNLSEKQIKQIDDFLNQYKNVLSGFSDLVGDEKVPINNKQFLFNLKHIGYLLDADPSKTISRAGVLARKLTTARFIKTVGGPTMSSKQVFEDRNELLRYNGITASTDKDKGIEVPKDPVIWVPNHHFKDDAMATIQAAKRPFYFMFGSLPLYFNTFDGILTYFVGAILINRRNKNSKRASLEKAKLAIDYNTDLFWAVEATHNKSANLLMLEPWDGVYRLAQEKGTKVIPISHYLIDPTRQIFPKELNTIHTVVDDPIDLTKFPSEKVALNYLRDVISSWYSLMMQKYGRMSRKDLIDLYEKRAIHYGISPEELQEHPLTTAEIGELYNLDLRSTVTGYDTIAETNANYHDPNIGIPEEVFEPISFLQNPQCLSETLYAKKLVKERKYENYQKRF